MTFSDLCAAVFIHRHAGRQRAAKLSALFFLPCLLAGCGTIGFPDNDFSTNPVYTSLTGNWQFTSTDANGQTFSALAGFVGETKGGSDGNDGASSLLQLTPANCYIGAPLLPSSGYATSTLLVLNSFSVNGQYVAMNLTKNTAQTQLTGTYQVSGGCGNGDTGTVTGTRYASVSGTFAGQSTSGGQKIQLSLTQATSPNADGSLALSGTAMFSGITCFSSGTVQNVTSYVLGSAFSMEIADPDGSSTSIVGTFDPTASTFTVSNATIAGGTCSGSLSVSSLQKS